MIYEGTITHVIIDDNGNDKLKKKNYVVNYVDTFEGAENALYKVGDGLTDFDVVAIKRSRIYEVANKRTDDNESLWLAELQDTFTDDDGNEKIVKYKILFYAKTFESAKTFITTYSEQGYNMELVSLKLTKFVDVI